MNSVDNVAFNEAVNLANQGDKVNAHNQLRALLIQNPHDINLLLWLAFTSPNLVQAEAYLNNANALEPNNSILSQAKNWLAEERAKQISPISPIFIPNSPAPNVDNHLGFALTNNSQQQYVRNDVSPNPNKKILINSTTTGSKLFSVLRGSRLLPNRFKSFNNKQLTVIIIGNLCLVVLFGLVLLQTVFHTKTAKELYYYKTANSIEDAVSDFTANLNSSESDRVAVKIKDLASYPSTSYNGALAIEIDAGTSCLVFKPVGTSPKCRAIIIFPNTFVHPKSGETTYYCQITSVETAYLSTEYIQLLKVEDTD